MKLARGEELLLDTRPHPLAFAGLYMLYTYILAVGLFFLFRPFRLQLNLPSFIWGLNTDLILLWLMLVIPMVAASIIKISWRWSFLAIGLAAVSTALYFYGYPLWIPELLVGLLGDLAVDFYRRGHHYYITSKRIVMEKRFLTVKVRELPISKINDVVLEIPFLGRIFGFGNVIPLTASGLGVGEDLALAGSSVKVSRFEVGVAGGRSVNVPRARTFLALYGVPDPENVSSLISSFLTG
ncbi:MAG: PH domain-containing protein [Candidatus Korarchaeota archaeon]|nr:PH domain-containing protein [Candidatus Korarchaeota archaeon]